MASSSPASDKAVAKAEAKAALRPGRVKRQNQFWADASQSRELAYRFIPLLSRFITVMGAVAVLAMAVSLVSLWLRPDPLVLLSYPDGTNRCTPPSVDPVTHRVHARPASQAETCATLDASNAGGDGQ